MASKQLLSEEVDARSDLYSMGSYYYERQTGKPSFEAKSPISLDREGVERDPRSVKPDMPHSISELVMRLLAKELVERGQSASTLREALASAG